MPRCSFTVYLSIEGRVLFARDLSLFLILEEVCH
nr:MAG TPA: hypothetical protein [Caudoviricetes sp.]